MLASTISFLQPIFSLPLLVKPQLLLSVKVNLDFFQFQFKTSGPEYRHPFFIPMGDKQQHIVFGLRKINVFLHVQPTIAFSVSIPKGGAKGRLKGMSYFYKQFRLLLAFTSPSPCFKPLIINTNLKYSMGSIITPNHKWFALSYLP